MSDGALRLERLLASNRERIEKLEADQATEKLRQAQPAEFAGTSLTVGELEGLQAQERARAALNDRLSSREYREAEHAREELAAWKLSAAIVDYQRAHEGCSYSEALAAVYACAGGSL